MTIPDIRTAASGRKKGSVAPKLDLSKLNNSISQQAARQGDVKTMPAPSRKSTDNPTSHQRHTHGNVTSPNHPSFQRGSAAAATSAASAAGHNGNVTPRLRPLPRTSSHESNNNTNSTQVVMTPRGGSYRDILLTPRGSRSLEAPLSARRPQSAPQHHHHLHPGGTPLPTATSTTPPKNAAVAVANASNVVASTKSKAPQQQPLSTAAEAATATTASPAPATKQQQQQNKQSNKKKASSKPKESTTITTITSPSAVSRSQAERIASEQVHVAQQIATLATTAAAHQDHLTESLEAVQVLIQKRDQLQKHVLALQAAAAQAQAVVAASTAEVQQLKATAAGLSATLDMASGTPSHGNDDGSDAVALQTARSSLLQLMRLSAHTLNMPAVVRALDDNNNSGSGSNANANFTAAACIGGVAAAAATTARSDMSTSRFETPATSVRMLDDTEMADLMMNHDHPHHRHHHGGDEDDDGPRSGATIKAAGSGGTGKALDSSSVEDVVKRGKIVMPRLRLPISTNGDNKSSGGQPRVSAVALARLESIRNKLEVAEDILSARPI